MKNKKLREILAQFKKEGLAYTLISLTVSVLVSILGATLFILNAVFDLGRHYPLSEIVGTILASSIFGFVGLMIMFIAITVIDVYFT